MNLFFLAAMQQVGAPNPQVQFDQKITQFFGTPFPENQMWFETAMTGEHPATLTGRNVEFLQAGRFFFTKMLDASDIKRLSTLFGNFQFGTLNDVLINIQVKAEKDGLKDPQISDNILSFVQVLKRVVSGTNNKVKLMVSVYAHDGKTIDHFEQKIIAGN